MRISGSFVFNILNTDTPINSKGNKFATIQEALDDLAGDGWVFVPEGEYAEAVVINHVNVELFGVGMSSYINGGAIGHAITVNSLKTHCYIHDLRVGTDSAGGNNYDGIAVNGEMTTIERVTCINTDRDCIMILNTSAKCNILHCFLDGTAGLIDANAIKIMGEQCRIIGNFIKNPGAYGINVDGTGDELLVTGNTIIDAGNDGILLSALAEDNCVVGNLIKNATNENIDDDSATSTVANNELI